MSLCVYTTGLVLIYSIVIRHVHKQTTLEFDSVCTAGLGLGLCAYKQRLEQQMFLNKPILGSEFVGVRRIFVVGLQQLCKRYVSFSLSHRLHTLLTLQWKGRLGQRSRTH